VTPYDLNVIPWVLSYFKISKIPKLILGFKDVADLHSMSNREEVIMDKDEADSENAPKKITSLF